MKKEGSLKLILSLLVIVLVILVSLGGIYEKDKNVMKNKLREYSLGMELDTNTIVKLEVSKPEEDSSEDTQEESKVEESVDDTETEVTTEDQNTETNMADESEETEESAKEAQSDENGQAKENIYIADNYKKAKKIIEERLKANGINEYTLRLDENTGSIAFEFSNTLDSSMLGNVFSKGNVEIKVKETDEVLGDFNSIKIINFVEDSGALRADIELSKDGQNKFKELKNSYQIPVDENGVQTDNTIALIIDGKEIFEWKESEFLNSATNGNVLIGYYNLEYKKLLEQDLNRINSYIQYGELPVDYLVEYSNVIHSNVNKIGVISVFAIILVAMLLYFVIKYKLLGIIAEINIIGFLSSLLLVFRYLNVTISTATIVSLVAIVILQFIYLIKLLNNKKISSKVFNIETAEFTKMIVPMFLFSVIIALAKIAEISGFGEVVFCGIILFEIFNNILTRAILTNVKNK